MFTILTYCEGCGLELCEGFTVGKRCYRCLGVKYGN